MLDSYLKNLYSIAGIPSIIFSSENASNLSETSLKMLFSQTENMARQMMYCLKDGMYKRTAYIRSLLKTQGILLQDEDSDSIDFTFSPLRPVDNKNLLEELKIQYEMGAISKKTILDLSPHTTDSNMEISRIEEEQSASPTNTKDEILSTNKSEEV